MHYKAAVPTFAHYYMRAFLVVHVDSRRRGTTPAAAGGIAEKGSDRPRRRCALKLATVAGLAPCCNLRRG